MDILSTLPLHILESIADELPHGDKQVMRQVSRLFRDIIPPCVTLHVKQLVKTLHITATVPEDLAEAFSSHHEHASSTTKKKNEETGMVKCVRTFAFPPTCEYSFFESARIEHFTTDKNFPIILTAANIRHLTNLLSGCTVRQISLAFEEATAHNLYKVPELVSKIGAKSVDFVLMRMHYEESFWNADFASDLVRGGVREVSFSGQAIEGMRRSQQGNANQEEFRSFTILLYLFDAGIESITINPKALVESVSDKAIEDLAKKLASLGRQLQLNLHIELQSVGNLRFRKERKEMLADLNRLQLDGVNVQASKSTKKIPNRSRDEQLEFISIECTEDVERRRVCGYKRKW